MGWVKEDPIEGEWFPEEEERGTIYYKYDALVSKLYGVFAEDSHIVSMTSEEFFFKTTQYLIDAFDEGGFVGVEVSNFELAEPVKLYTDDDTQNAWITVDLFVLKTSVSFTNSFETLNLVVSVDSFLIDYNNINAEDSDTHTASVSVSNLELI